MGEESSKWELRSIRLAVEGMNFWKEKKETPVVSPSASKFPHLFIDLSEPALELPQRYCRRVMSRDVVGQGLLSG